VWERATICHAIGDGLMARCEELARLQTLEQGKLLQESRDDIAEAATLFHLHAEDAVRLTGETLPSTDPNKRMWTFYRPVGTWAIITPWKYPLLMFAEFVAPGLATATPMSSSRRRTPRLPCWSRWKCCAKPGCPRAW
jgi:acyl-CoA reductase-like NAD-dependent aldehyde dehydrogenase